MMQRFFYFYQLHAQIVGAMSIIIAGICLVRDVRNYYCPSSNSKSSERLERYPRGFHLSFLYQAQSANDIITEASLAMEGDSHVYAIRTLTSTSLSPILSMSPKNPFGTLITRPIELIRQMKLNFAEVFSAKTLIFSLCQSGAPEDAVFSQ
jgi:hypothetical protein